MPPEQPRLAETRLGVDLESLQNPGSSVQPASGAISDEPVPESADGSFARQSQLHDGGKSDDGLGQDRGEDDNKIHNRPLNLSHVRDVVRLFQCRYCSRPLRNATTLPCGRSICKTCIPETHIRTSITYPNKPDRLQRFQCPFEECSKEHALSDCAADVVLRKVGELIEQEIQRGQGLAVEFNLSTIIGVKDPWDAAGISSLKDTESMSHTVEGGRLVATWSLASEGYLAVETEVTYADTPPTTLESNLSKFDLDSLRLVQSAARNEMDCQVCYSLFHDPLTTCCGHTFCRSCLHRTLDHSHQCPMCRRMLIINPLLNPELCPSNGCIAQMIELFWPKEKLLREEAVTSERLARHEDLDLPLFVCTLAFPSMPTFLHVFEPRYRLMIRRALEGNRTFGMVLPKRPRDSNDAYFHELGTLLRIINAQFYPDGRSLIESVGVTRFRVLRRGELDGYAVAKTERIDDVFLQEEEAIEAAEVATGATRQRASNSSGNNEQRDSTQADDGTVETEGETGLGVEVKTEEDIQPTPTMADLQFMSTESLMRLATDFVARMRAQSVPWLTARMLSIYGECPDDPAIFPWWFASMLPVKDLEKYRLLGTSSVRERLKVCCSWIVEWETTRW